MTLNYIFWIMGLIFIVVAVGNILSIAKLFKGSWMIAIKRALSTLDDLKKAAEPLSAYDVFDVFAGFFITAELRERMRSLFARVGNPLGVRMKIYFMDRVLINATLLETAAELFAANSKKGTSDDSATVLGMMLCEKALRLSGTKFMLISACIISLVADIFFDLSAFKVVFIVCTIFYASLEIDHELIRYRVRRGVFGTNEMESRELISFMSSHPNKDDFNDDNGGLKRVVPDAESEGFESQLDVSIDGVKS